MLGFTNGRCLTAKDITLAQSPLVFSPNNKFNLTKLHCFSSKLELIKFEKF